MIPGILPGASRQVAIRLLVASYQSNHRFKAIAEMAMLHFLLKS
jgi:hypothetical protein